MALALALQQRGQRAQIFEARARHAFAEDQRILALSFGSRQILESLGAWAQLEATPILAIHVSQRGGFARTRISAAEERLPALGYVVAASALGQALDAALRRAEVCVRERVRVSGAVANAAGVELASSAGTVPAQLVVWAEGGAGEAAIEHDYGQSAVICTVEVATPHANTAWERFTEQGPIALLPLGPRMALVYSCASARAEELIRMDDAAFLADLQANFGTRLEFVAATPRALFPLSLRYRRSPLGARSIWLGNAAQTLHPVAGQGFNLALRDVMQLARSLAGASDPGHRDVLAAYAAARRLDRIASIRLTDALVRAFAVKAPLARAARGAALLALDLAPPLRHFLARRMIFGARAY